MHNKVNNKKNIKLVFESIKIFNKTFCGQRASNGFFFFLIIMCQFHGFRKFFYTDEFLLEAKINSKTELCCS